MRKVFDILVLAVLLTIVSSSSAALIPAPNVETATPLLYFSDVPADAWYYPYVTGLYEQGVLRDPEGGAFRPDDPVTWGEAFQLVLGAIGVRVEETTGGENWALDYLPSAIENRLVYSFNTEYLNQPVNRRNIARMTARAMDLVGIAEENPYVDCDDGYVAELFEKNILKGGEDTGGPRYFLPGSTMTRAEMAQLVWRVANSDYTDDMIRVNNYWVDIFKSVPLSPFAPEQFYPDDLGRMAYDGWYTLGVDVSEFQGVIDWEAVAADGVSFAIIRCGGRFTQSGGLFEDKYFTQNVEGALAAGLDVGVYFFSQALNTQEGLEEAEFVLELIRDYDLHFPVVCDWEYLGNYSATNHARTYLAEPNDVTDGIAAFCERIEEEGFAAGVYFNEYCGMIKMDLSRLNRYSFWYAQYTGYPSCVYDFQLWQYTEQGRVAGISGAIDMNICFKRRF